MKLRLITMSLLLFVVLQSSDQENEKIEKVIKGYIENFFLNDYDKMEVHLHERIAKRGILPTGKLSKDYSKQDLKELMSTKKAMPLKWQRNIIKGIKVYDRVATAILETGYPKTRWKEYIHLVKLKGNWIILDVAWCFDKISD